MPLLVINERVSSDLAALSRLPSKEYVSEFCRQALEALGAGAKRAALKQAAQLLSLDLDTVSGAVMALSLLFVEAAKRNCSAADLAMSMGDIAVPEDSKREVSDFYGAHLGELREGLGCAPSGAVGADAEGSGAEAGAAAAAAASAGAPALTAVGVALAREELRGGAGALLPASGASATLPEYRGLEWRLQVEVSRRAAHGTLAPGFLLQLGVAGLGPEAEGGAGGGGGASSSSSSAGSSQEALAAAGPHALSFSADFQTLKRAAASLATAGLERSKSHVKRVYKI